MKRKQPVGKRLSETSSMKNNPTVLSSEEFIEQLYENLTKASSYLNLCIRVCSEEQPGLCDLSVVLTDARGFLSNLSVLFDHIPMLVNRGEEFSERNT